MSLPQSHINTSMTNPKNIVIWCPARSGSTSLMRGARLGLKEIHGPSTASLWEATGRYGILGPKDAHGTEKNFNFAPWIDTPVSLNYHPWFINKRGSLRRNRLGKTGNPRTELPRRARLIREGNWQNSVIFKNMRWSNDSGRSRLELNELFDTAILTSSAEFHHIVLWRKDLFKWISSTFVFSRTQQAHGTVEWDGKLFGDPAHFTGTKYTSGHYKALEQFIISSSRLPKEKTVMIETNSINAISELVWPDSTRLALPNNATLLTGKVNYVDTRTGAAVTPIDLIHPHAIKLFRAFEAKCNKHLDWQNLDKNLGFTSQSI